MILNLSGNNIRKDSINRALIISLIAHFLLALLFIFLSIKSEIIMIPRSKKIRLTGIKTRSSDLLQKNISSKKRDVKKKDSVLPEYAIKKSKKFIDTGEVKLKEVEVGISSDALIEQDIDEMDFEVTEDFLSDVDINEREIDSDLSTGIDEADVARELDGIELSPSSLIDREGNDEQLVWDDPAVIRKIETIIQPEYPDELVKAGKEGEVVFKVWVTVQGFIQNVEIVKSTGHTELDELAKKAVYKWKVEPIFNATDAQSAEVKFLFKIKK